MADNTFLQSVLGGAQLAERGLERDLRVQEMAGREAERSLRMEQLRQEMQFNAVRINQVSDEVARKAKIDTMQKLALQNFQRDREMGKDVGEAVLANFGPVAAMSGGNIDDVVRAGVALQREEMEAPLKKQEAAAKLKLTEAQTDLAKARAVSAANPKEFAPTTTMKDREALQRAYDEGDERGIEIFEKKLGLRGLDDIDKVRYRAEIEAIKSDPILGINVEKRTKAMDEVEKKYREKAGKSSAPAQPPTPARKFRFDPATNKLVPE